MCCNSELARLFSSNIPQTRRKAFLCCPGCTASQRICRRSLVIGRCFFLAVNPRLLGSDTGMTILQGIGLPCLGCSLFYSFKSVKTCVVAAQIGP